MSGGHYDYKWHQIEMLADEIREDLERSKEDEKFEKGYSGFEYSINGYLIEAIGPNSPAREKVERIMKDLYRLAKETKEVEWLLSGDTGVETFLGRITELEEKNKQD